jgi:hypothetical protein
MGTRSIKSWRCILSVLLSACLSVSIASAQDETDGDTGNPWPREIQAAEGTVIVYQPQPQELDGDRLQARAAISVTLEGTDEPVFGVVWLDARISTDRDDRTAAIEDLKVSRMRFTEQGDGKGEKLRALLEKEIPEWALEISLDRLLTTLELVRQRADMASQINTDAPVILFVPEPAVLVTLDGEPRLKAVEGRPLMRVVNTPFSILLDTEAKTYYLNADSKIWYSASDIDGDWTVAESVPKAVAERAPEPDPEENDDLEADDPETDDDDAEPGPPPKIVVATVPTELISSAGEPEYTPISGTELLYMSNTDSDVFLHLTDQRHFVLLAGRWYASTSLDGPWSYVPGNELPGDFSKISEDSQMATVLYAVPGTDVARDAAMDAQIPQTAKVERDKASLEVKYDGQPKFDEISGTTMEYAVNTAAQVIHVEKEYYAVDDGIWFVATAATGPWRVATSVPDVIYTIPPESPVYNVTFVFVYDSTPEVVYVGYTSGYTGTYVYNTTIVYGTGYYYPSWYYTYYYPRPATWGFHVRYNPWTGWHFGLSYSTGPFTFVIGGGGWYRGGWWGPYRYRGYRGGYRHGYRRGAHAGYRAGYRAGQRNNTRNNLYRSNNNPNRSAITSRQPGGERAKPGTAGGAKPGTANRANNVYADRDGNVHRKTDQGWQERTDKGWENQTRDAAKTQDRSATGRESASDRSRETRNSSTQQLNSSQQARERGTQRTNSYNRSRTAGGSRSGGARGGGGGGRRR